MDKLTDLFWELVILIFPLRLCTQLGVLFLAFSISLILSVGTFMILMGM